MSLTKNKTIKNNFTASASPTVNDDANSGYSNGSIWYYNSTVSICVDSTVGAAVWSSLNFDGALTLQGQWDASTNTPTLVNGTGVNGYAYVVSVAGTVDFGSGDVTFTVGDLVIYDASDTWNKFETGVSYVPEDEANKATDFTTLNDTLYPSVQAVEDRTKLFSNENSTLSTTKQLTNTSSSVQKIDPDGSNRIVKAEDTPEEGRFYYIYNLDATGKTIEFQNFAGTQIGNLIYSQSCGFFAYDSTNGWTELITGTGINNVALGQYQSITQIDVDSLQLFGGTIRTLSGVDLNLTSDSGEIKANDDLVVNTNLTIGSNTLTINDTDGNLTIIPDGSGHVDVFTPPATEESGINVNGTVYDSCFRINDIGGTAPAQAIFHRHSTTLAPLLMGARTNDDTSGHTAITNGQSTLSLYGTGWTGSHYDITSQIDFSADATGTISPTSSPGRIRFFTTPDGSNTPAVALTLDKDKKASFSGDVDIDSGTIDGVSIGASTPATQINVDDLSFFSGTIRTAIGSATDLTILSDTNANISLVADGTGSISLSPFSSGNTTVFDTPSTYDTGVNIGVSTYSKMFRVIHSGGSEKAQAMLIRHSTTEAPTLIGGRANSDTDTPATIANDQESLVFQGVGYSGTGHYDIMAQIKMKTPASGTINSTSMPGEIVLSTTKAGEQAVTDALTIDEGQNVTVHTGDLILSSGNITVSGTVDGRDVASDGTKLDELASQTVTNDATTTRTLALTDANDYIRFTSASDTTLTVPLNSSVAFPTGTRIDFSRMGVGNVTVAATGGVTINKAEGLKIAAQYKAATLVKVATDEWDLFGALAA